MRFAARSLAALIVAAGLAWAWPSGSASAAGSASAGFIRDVASARAGQGVHALGVSSRLAQVAAQHTAAMAREGRLFHNPNLSSVPGWQEIGENVGYGPDEASVARAFMNSPEHRANILRSTYTLIGVATQVDANGRLWVTEDFERPFATAAPSVGSSTKHHASSTPVKRVTAAPPHRSSHPVTHVSSADVARRIDRELGLGQALPAAPATPVAALEPRNVPPAGSGTSPWWAVAVLGVGPAAWAGRQRTVRRARGKPADGAVPAALAVAVPPIAGGAALLSWAIGLPAWQIVLVTLLAANCALVGVVATGPLRGALRRARAAGSAPALAAVGVLAALALADAAGPRVGLNRTVAGLAAVGLLLVVVLFSRGRRRMRQLDQLLEMPLTEPVPVDARRLEPATTSRVTAIAERTRAVLEARQMEMALQPIIDLNTGAWVSAEALARFPDARQPNEWISEAYEAGLGPDLELQAVETALATAAHLPEDVRLAVNVSPAMTLDPRFIERITACGLALDRIILEITEHTTVSHYPSIERALSPLRANGLALAVDDAGAGYASFAHVLQLRPEIIKLDRSLTLGIDHEPAARAFVTGVMLLALELRAAVVAEGVETGEELATLETLGIDFAQGYLLAMPSMNPHDWQAWPDRTWDVGQITPEPTPVRASSPGTIRLTASTPTVHV